VLLGEPARSQGDVNFRLFGIPVRIHPFFWIIGLLLGMNNDVKGMIVWLVALFLCILVHELGHALVLRAFGVYSWITLYGMGGLASYDPAQARSARADGTLKQILISAAGPGAGFLLAALVFGGVLLKASFTDNTVAPQAGIDYLAMFISYILFICVVWGIVNLLPVYPLDGGQIAREIMLRILPRTGIHHSLMLSIFTAGGIPLLALLNRELYIAIMFGYLAFSSFQTLQNYGNQRHW
jgi:stage IV sporulation protein FB